MKWKIKRKDNKIIIYFYDYIDKIDSETRKELAKEAVESICKAFNIKIKKKRIDNNKISVIIDNKEIYVLFECIYAIKTKFDWYILQGEYENE